MVRYVLCLGMIIFGSRAYAQIQVASELGYAQDSSGYGSSTSTGKTIVGLSLYMPFKSGSPIAIGFEYLQNSGNGVSSTGSEVSYVTTSPLFGVQCLMGPKDLYRLYLSYSPIVRSEIKVANSLQSWTGSATQIRFALAPLLTDKLALIVGVNYYAASFTERSGAASNVSAYDQVYVSPSLGLSYSFK